MANWKERRLRNPLPSKHGSGAPPQCLVEHPPTTGEGAELTLLSYEILQNTQSLSPSPNYTPNPHWHHGNPISGSSPLKGAGNAAAHEGIHQTRLPSTLPIKLLPSPPSAQQPHGKSTQSSGQRPSRVNTLMNEALGTFIFPSHHATSPPWPLTFMPCTIGLPVGRSQMHWPRGFDQ